MSEDTPPDPREHFKLLIVDSYLADRVVIREMLEESLTSIYPGLKPELHEARSAEEGLELLSQHNFNLAIFDANFNPLNPNNIAGINRFLVPARSRGYSGQIICWSNPNYRVQALEKGADVFWSKVNGDYEGLPAIIRSLLESQSTQLH